ncbi:LysM peptidoglycan-binding and 3D domain-containing protein [Bacillus changyiensis]|uniref:LysM peptidoglycan-binding and 3D domain-containing protein n=1 Tax=Bacillus changyiensis TaxID=3004103 RepID=UPI0022E130D4|nr:LysM peptidoglycan-binding and 3D domain-containing protein [Bacillus changyiensis]MDA1475855.1 LysM peptidoglycan-binding domain-containing protein [Bacillus changyiensis]
MKKTMMSLIAAFAFSATAFGVNASAKEIKVENGDTLWGISQQYGMNLKDLKKWNQLSSDIILPGQKLNISLPKEESNQHKYTVKSGDTLAKVAKKFAVDVQDLRKWNNITSDLIITGETITVYQKSTNDKQLNTQTNTQRTTKEITVTATAYSANDGGISGITKTGIDLNRNQHAKVIAVDPSVIPLGSKVYVEGYGEAIAADTGSAIRGNKIDVFIANKGDALNWGVKTVKVKILD